LKISHIFFLTILFFWVVSCSRFDTFYEVAYEVNGTSTSVNITFKDGEGKTREGQDVQPPWVYILNARKGFVAFCTVKNNRDSGQISVELYKEGKLLKSATSDTAFALISVSDTL